MCKKNIFNEEDKESLLLRIEKKIVTTQIPLPKPNRTLSPIKIQ